MRSKFIEVEGERYHYLSMGDESRPLLLFVHGFPEFSLTWREQLKHFSDRFHAVAVDMKGYNLSSKPKDVAAYNSTTVADGLFKFAKKLSPSQPFFVVAHDWGGSISWLMASEHKDDIKALVILNVGHPLVFFREYMKGPAAPGQPPEQYDLSVYIRNIREGKWNEDYYSKDGFKNFADPLFTNDVGVARRFFDDQTKLEYLRAWSQVDSATGVSALTASLNYYRAMNVPEPSWLVRKKIWIAELLGKMRISVPTLVLWGRGDQYVSENVNVGLDRFFSNASLLTLKKFDGLTHWILHEDPDLVNREIDQYLATFDPKYGRVEKAPAPVGTGGPSKERAPAAQKKK